MEQSLNTITRNTTRILLLVIVGIAMNAAKYTGHPTMIMAFNALCWVVILLNIIMLILDIRDLLVNIFEYRIKSSDSAGKDPEK